MFFAKREIRALALLLPIIVAAVAIVVLSRRAVVEPTADVDAEPDTPALCAPALHRFDPNTVSYEELRAMGFDRFAARNIVKRRATADYQIPEDVAVVYGISDSTYAAIKPYIAIAPEFRPQRRRTATESRAVELHPFDANTLDAEGLYALGIFSARQAEAMVRYREQRGGFRSLLEFRDCYLVGDSLYTVLAPYVTLSPLPEPEVTIIELNTADSAALVRVRGIGAVTASAIVDYRERLGGYHSVEQLKELRVMTERNYEEILKQISVDSCKIQKIDINFAAPKELGAHPYLTPARVRKILKHRQLKGGWNRIEEMVDDNILTLAEAKRIAPYLQFNPPQK